MSLETLSFILGGILIASAVFGGGLEVKELKLPKIGTIGRIMAAIVGVGFILLAIYLSPKGPVGGVKPADSTPTKATMTFQSPMHGVLRLDACKNWAQNCGEPAATAWCKMKGFSRATEYPQENVGNAGLSTQLIGTNEVCNEKFCASFVYITCEK